MRLRNFVFTLNNYSIEDMELVMEWIALNASYGIFGKETASTGTPHLQGYVELKKQARFKTVQKALPKGIHLENRKGTARQASDYCKKEDETPFVYGVISNPGKRTDIAILKKLVVKPGGLLQCYEENFGLTCRMSRGLKEYRQLEYNARSHDFRKVTVEVYWGAAGTGKTRKAAEEHPLAYYVPLRKDKQLWFDGYDGQDTLIIDDFYGGAIYYATLLKLLDGYKYNAPVKGGFVPANWTTVIITSNKSPEEWYPDGLTGALRRRITKTIHFSIPFPSIQS